MGNTVNIASAIDDIKTNSRQSMAVERLPSAGDPTDPVYAAATRAALEDNVRGLVDALFALWEIPFGQLAPERTETDVPIWFTYDLLYYGIEAPANYVVFKINGINYFYIHPNQPTVDQVIDILPLLNPLVNYKEVINPFTQQPQKPSVEVGYYDAFATFHPVRSLSAARPGALVDSETPFEATGLDEVLAGQQLDPTTRQLLMLTSKRVGTKFTLPPVKLSIPQFPESHPDPANQQLWLAIRTNAIKTFSIKGKHSVDRLSTLEPLRTAAGWMGTSMVIIGQCTNKDILARLIQYGYEVVNTETNPDLLKSLALEALYIVENESPVYVDRAITNTIYKTLTKLATYTPPRTDTNLAIRSHDFGFARRDLFELTGYAHHETILALFRSNNLMTAADNDHIFTRYPYPNTTLIGRQAAQVNTSISEVAELKKLLLARRPINKFYPSLETVLTLVADSDIDVAARAELIHLFIGRVQQIVANVITDLKLNVDSTTGYFDVIGKLKQEYATTQHAKVREIKKQLDELTTMVDSFKQLLGLHFFIDTAVQKLLYQFSGVELPGLINNQCLVVAPTSEFLPEGTSVAGVGYEFKTYAKNKSADFLFMHLESTQCRVQVYENNTCDYMRKIISRTDLNPDPTAPGLPDMFIVTSSILLEPYMVSYLRPTK